MSGFLCRRWSSNAPRVPPLHAAMFMAVEVYRARHEARDEWGKPSTQTVGSHENNLDRSHVGKRVRRRADTCHFYNPREAEHSRYALFVDIMLDSALNEEGPDEARRLTKQSRCQPAPATPTPENSIWTREIKGGRCHLGTPRWRLMWFDVCSLCGYAFSKL